MAAELVARVEAEAPDPARGLATIHGALYVVALRGWNEARREREKRENEALRALDALKVARASEADWHDALGTAAVRYAVTLGDIRAKDAARTREKEARERRAAAARDMTEEEIAAVLSADDLW